MAHSMGNYVLRHALQQAKKITNDASLVRIFDNIVLTAADEDSDAFEHDHNWQSYRSLRSALRLLQQRRFGTGNQ